MLMIESLLAHGLGMKANKEKASDVIRRTLSDVAAGLDGIGDAMIQQTLLSGARAMLG